MVGPSHISNLPDFFSCCTSSASSQRKFSDFKSWKQIWATQIIQDNFFIWRSLTLTVSFLSQVVGIRAWTIEDGETILSTPTLSVGQTFAKCFLCVISFNPLNNYAILPITLWQRKLRPRDVTQLAHVTVRKYKRQNLNAGHLSPDSMSLQWTYVLKEKASYCRALMPEEMHGPSFMYSHSQCNHVGRK